MGSWMKQPQIREDTTFEVRTRKGMDLDTEWRGVGMGGEDLEAGLGLKRLFQECTGLFGWRGPGENGRRGKSCTTTEKKNTV